MKTAICFILIISLCMPMNFSFTNTREYIEDTVDTLDGAFDTVKGIFGNDSFNNEVPQQNDVADKIMQLGADDSSVRVSEYMQWRISDHYVIPNESFITIKHVSDKLYDVYLRDSGQITKKRWTSIRMTISFNWQDNEYECDVFWIGPYSFDNESLDEFRGTQIWAMNEPTGDYSPFYIYHSDSMLLSITNWLDLVDYTTKNPISFYFTAHKSPKSISVKDNNSTFTRYFDEWTGG